MSKILKSLCCSMLFAALSLCGASAADYMYFYDSKPYKCNCCGKQASSMTDNWKNTKNSNLVSIMPSEMPDYYPCYRKIGSYRLMCEQCKMKDHNEQIRGLVLKFCHKFNFNKPFKEDVDYLLNNSKFLSQFPIDRPLGEEGGRFVNCDFCNKEIDLLFSNSYDICKCGAPTHEGCMVGSNHFSECTKKDEASKLLDQKLKFQLWFDNGCKAISFLDPSILNMGSVTNSVYSMIASGEMENPFGDTFKLPLSEKKTDDQDFEIRDKNQKCLKCFDCAIF